MAKQDKATLLREANEFATELRQGLVKTITPADISATAKVPFNLRVLRELLLHRVSDLSDAACLQYNNGSTIPALVLTRAAFETMAMLFYLKKNVEAALKKRDVEALAEIAMKGTFGAKDNSTPFEAVNVLTVISHLEKKYPELKEAFGSLCEFAHPNCAGLMVPYYGVKEINLDNLNVPLALGRESYNLKPNFGLQCLCIAISMAVWFARELAKSDKELVSLCEDDLMNG